MIFTQLVFWLSRLVGYDVSSLEFISLKLRVLFNGLLYSPHNWVVFHPLLTVLYTLKTTRGPFISLLMSCKQHRDPHLCIVLGEGIGRVPTEGFHEFLAIHSLRTEGCPWKLGSMVITHY